MTYRQYAQGVLTLGEARSGVMSSLDVGIVCPCCDKYCRRYKRKLNSAMARGLIWIVRQFRTNGGAWIHLPSEAPRFVISTNQMGTVAKWGLLVSRESDDGTKRESGYWVPTFKGEDFVDGKISVPKFVYLYNNEPQEFSEERTTIQDALGDRFDYQKLMKGE